MAGTADGTGTAGSFPTGRADSSTLGFDMDARGVMEPSDEASEAAILTVEGAATAAGGTGVCNAPHGIGCFSVVEMPSTCLY